MNEQELIIAMRNLRDSIDSSKLTQKTLKEELKVSNLIKLHELGLISDEVLREMLEETEYSELITKSHGVKANIRK